MVATRSPQPSSASTIKPLVFRLLSIPSTTFIQVYSIPQKLSLVTLSTFPLGSASKDVNTFHKLSVKETLEVRRRTIYLLTRPAYIGLQCTVNLPRTEERQYIFSALVSARTSIKKPRVVWVRLVTTQFLHGLATPFDKFALHATLKVVPLVCELVDLTVQLHHEIFDMVPSI